MQAFLPHSPSLVYLHPPSHLPHASRFYPPRANLQSPPPAKIPPSPPPQPPPSSPSPPSEPGIQLLANDLRSIFSVLTTFLRPSPRPKPRSATGARIASTYVRMLGAASRATGRVVFRLQAARGMLAGWDVLRPFQWQLGGAESREMWKGQVERFVRRTGGVAGMFEGVWGFVKGVLGVVEGAIGKGLGRQRLRGGRKQLGKVAEKGKQVVPLGRRMRVRPHSGDPNYVAEARVEAFKRRARELGQLTDVRDGDGMVIGDMGSDAGGDFDAGTSVREVQGEVCVDKGGGEEQGSTDRERSRGGEKAEVGTVATLSVRGRSLLVEERGKGGVVKDSKEETVQELVDDAVERIGENGYQSPGSFTSPTFSGTAEIVKRGATTALGVGVVAGAIAALPGIVTGAAVFVAGGALMSARVGGVDVETRRLFRRSETGKVMERVVEGLGTMGTDGVVETTGRAVGEGQPAVLDVPVIGLVLGWLDDVAYLGEKGITGIVRTVAGRNGQKSGEWQLLESFRRRK